MTATTQTIREQAIAVIECDVPEGVTLGEYRALNCHRPSRWEKARVGILGAGIVGILAETVLSQRAVR